MNIKKRIHIDAPPALVWKVFTDPELSREMGGEYVSDWKPGSTLQWKGKDGKMYTHGTVLAIEENKMIKHNLHDMDNKSMELSVITYHFMDDNNGTLLLASEVLGYHVSDEEYEEISAGWDLALDLVKKIAEKQANNQTATANQ